MSVGGSLIVPQEIDTLFLKKLKILIEDEIAHHERHFILISGGGKTARKYQEAARDITELEPDDLDWLGIHATRLNGHLLRTIFKDEAYPVMITDPEDILQVPKQTPLVIAAGHHPGASTDYRAVQIAGHIGAKKVINLSNIDYIYTADPRKDMKAQEIEDITWSEFRNLIPEEWDPGLSSPFDPIAARAAEELGIEVASINGDDLTELSNYLEGKPFVGTRIHP
jgi:uridylate kinase